MKYSVVTTFNASGYKQYGSRMVDTFLATWPQDVQLLVYAEDVAVTQQAPNLKIVDLAKASPELVEFKRVWGSVPKANGDVSSDPVRGKRKDAGKGFKWNAVRFAHKVYAVFNAARTCGTEWLIWMDADMVCHSKISTAKLDEFFPATADLCYAGRANKFTECGLYGMHLTSAVTQEFLAEFQRMYDDAENGIFTLKEWHDSFVFDAVRHKFAMQELNWSAGLITGEGHPLINCEWGTYIDHLKGTRKDQGRSRKSDLVVQRKETYWQ
jgi:hypothetical protein